MPLMKLKNLIVPQDDVFFNLMGKQADTAGAASEALHSLLKDYNNMGTKLEEIRKLEHQGDDLMRDIYIALNKTFIVPIDHEDISTLANALDDVIDLIDQAATLMVVYDIKQPTPAMVNIAGILAEQTGELKKAVSAISHHKTYGNVAAHCKRIKQFESKADEEYIKALTKLFKGTDAIEIVKHKEIIDCLETATDKVDKAAQHISDINMRYS